MADQRNGGIAWCDKTWNVLRGCSKVSAGCQNCYGARMALRFAKPGQPYHDLAYFDDSGFRERCDGPEWTGKVLLIEEHLIDPLRWKKPCRIFVNAMSDVFHPSVPDEWIDRIFAVMAMAPQHTFQVLTKRPERMRDYMSHGNGIMMRLGFWASHILGSSKAAEARDPGPWPLKNVWLGVSVEDQAAADERIPLLLQTPAALRFVSCEPLLGLVEFGQLPNPGFGEGQRYYDALRRIAWYASGPDYYDVCNCEEGIDWIIVGGESVPGARPMHPDWVRSIRDQCAAEDVPFLFKSWGEWNPELFGDGLRVKGVCSDPNNKRGDSPRVRMWRVGKKRAGRMLDGREHMEFPR